jgi:hypothetical protein
VKRRLGCRAEIRTGNLACSRQAWMPYSNLLVSNEIVKIKQGTEEGMAVVKQKTGAARYEHRCRREQLQQGTIVAGNNCSRSKSNREQKGTSFAWNRFSMGKKLFSNSFKFTNEFGTFTSKSFIRTFVLL